MTESLLSVGVDVGTTTTQLILSRLQIENRAGSFAVPQMQITGREILYRSPVHFTPLLDENRVDEGAIRALVAEAYKKAGIARQDVDTGAIIITGETSRKENAAAVLKALEGFAGEFVAAAAGPDLESMLAAKGSGAVSYSRRTGKTVLHMDIGGGTSNLALIRGGQIVATGCLNVGGRLLKFDPYGKVTYVSKVLEGLTDLRPGDYPAPTQVEGIARILTTALEMAAGRRPETELMQKLLTREAAQRWEPPREAVVVSFSGGVAECVESPPERERFGDMGQELGKAIRGSLLCKQEYILGKERIRATVIGAGCHSAQLSGSTVFSRGIQFPLKNIPVIRFSREQQEDPGFGTLIARQLQLREEPAVMVAFPGYPDASYPRIGALAQQLLQGIRSGPVLVCMEADMAKALGQKLSLLLPEERPCLCLDGICPEQDSYLDIGSPVGPALPVVIKTLVLENQ